MVLPSKLVRGPGDPLPPALAPRLLALAFVVLPALLSAQTATWEGGEGPLWSSGGNWLAGSVPVPGDTLVFTGEDDTESENDLAPDFLVGGLSIERTDAASFFSLSGNRLVLGGDVTTSGVAGDSHLLSLGLLLDGTRTFGIATGNDLSISGSIDEDAPGRGIVKAGAGTLVLAGDNGFSGNVSVQSGVLRLAHGGALGGSSLTEVANGARVELSGGITVAASTISIAGNGGNFNGALQSVSGANVWSGDLFLAQSGARIGANPGAPLTIAGNISDGGTNRSLAIRSANGAGTILLSGVGSYGGNTDLVVGTLRLAGGSDRLPTGSLLVVGNSSNVSTATFDLGGHDQQVNGLRSAGTTMAMTVTNTEAGLSLLTSHLTGSETYGGVLSGNLGFVKSGPGTQTLSGANTHTGPVTVTEGILRLAHDEALGAADGTATVLNGGRISLADGVDIDSRTVTLNGGGGNAGGALQTDANATATWSGDIVLGTSARLGGGVDGTLIVNGTISGSGGVVVGRNNNATTVFNAANTYSGATTLFANGGDGSRLVVGIDDALPATSTLNTLGALATRSMVLDLNGHRQTLQGLDSSANHIGGALLEVSNDGASDATLVLSSPNTYNFSGTITDGASVVHLVKEGGGTQRLFGNNTFTGSTVVRAGTLQVGLSESGLGANGRLASSQILLEGGVLDINNLGADNQSNDRVDAASVFHLRGGSLVYRGSDQASVDSAETLGDFVFERGISRVTNVHGDGNASLLTIERLLRPAGGGLGFFNGEGFGREAASTSSIARFLLGTAPDLVGGSAALAGGINSSAKDTEIVPFLLGRAESVSGGLGQTSTVPNTFVTYHPDTGLRPLNPIDEFTANDIVPGHNTRVTESVTVAADATVNSLLIEGAGSQVSIATGVTLGVESGAVLFVSGSAPRINGPGTLDFGSREGLVTVNSTGNTFLTARLAGLAGITFHGSGSLVLTNGASTYSGDTVLRVAQAIPTVGTAGPAGAPTSGPFGTGRLVLDGSAMRSTESADTTLGNELVVRADTVFLDSANPKRLIFTGPATLEGGDRRLVQNSSADTVFAGAIGDGGEGHGLVVAGSGSGAIVLAGANTYGGGTHVESATLFVNNTSGSGTGTGAVSVAAGATLGGTGTISGPASLGPGANLVGGTAGGIGTLTFGGDLSTDGSFWLVDLVHDLDGVSDRIVVVGDLALGGSTLVLATSGSFVPNTGHTFTIATYAGDLSGTFAGLGEGDQIGDYFISYGSGNNGAITLTAVPEPGTFLLLGLGFGGYLLRRRRK